MKKLITIILLCNTLLLAKDYALIIGVSKYKNMKNLSHIDSDISTYKTILTQRGVPNINDVNIKLLTNTQVTRDEIKKYLKYVVKDIKKFKNNRFFMFFAGHGIDTKYLEYDPQILKAGVDKYLTNSGVILPYNYDKKNISKTIIIGKRDLRPYLEEIDKHVSESLIIIDACYSGKSIRGEKDGTPYIYSDSKDYPYNNIVYIASATSKEQAESSVLSTVLNRCLNKLNNLQKLRACMNKELMYTSQRATVISKSK